MTARTILAACIVLAATPAFGLPPKPGAGLPGAWIVDDRTGCKIWDLAPRPNDSATWSGACRGGRAHGAGSLDWFRDGNLTVHFEGTMSNGKMSGRGVETFASGDRLEGMFRDGNARGRGVYTFADGDRFDGYFRDGKPNGHGVYWFANGNRYDGQWRNGRADGWGVKTYASGDRYVGQWKDDKMNGRGSF